jgi:hypothetical protein
MFEYAAKATKSITFSIVLTAAGVLFLVLALGGAIVLGDTRIPVSHVPLRVAAAVLGLLLVTTAIGLELHDRRISRNRHSAAVTGVRTGRVTLPADPLGQLPRDVTVTCYEQFPQEEFLRLVAQAKTHIWVQQTWISDWNSLCRVIKKSLEASPMGARPDVQLLFAHPESHLAEARGVHSGEAPGEVKAKIEATISGVVRYRDRHQFSDNEWRVRLFATLPTFALFRVDDEFFVTPYLCGRNTLNSPCYRLQDKSQTVASYLQDHFRAVWNESSRAELTLREVQEVARGLSVPTPDTHGTS